jgi:hypothetical protein
MSKLLESEFLAVNLSSVLKTQSSFREIELATKSDQQKSAQKRDLHQISDWSKELKDRLAANSQLSSEQQKSDYEIETDFFEDFFKELAWDDECAKQLLSLGEPLRKAIKVLGFDKNVNPILGFLVEDVVVRNLIQTKYLNINTFKAIYNAIAKNLVANSEFFKVNDYNIIYCQDLYKRSASEMEKYLIVQKSILNPSADAYTATDQRNNKLVFFYLEDVNEPDLEKRKVAIKNLPEDVELPNATDTNTILNNIELVNKLSGSSSGSRVKADIKPEKQKSGIAELSNSITNAAEAFAVLQQLSITTDVPEVVAAMQHDSFKSLGVSDIIKATANIKPKIKRTRLSDDEVKSFIKLVLSRLN